MGCALLPVGPLGAVKPTEGVADVAKKPDGYVRVTKPPTASAPPAVVVNENVTAAFVLPATRSVAATENEVFVTELHSDGDSKTAIQNKVDAIWLERSITPACVERKWK